MPFKSQAQRAKFGELVKQGKVSQAEFDKWSRETDHAKLPERVSVASTVTRVKGRPHPATKKRLRKQRQGR